jgi:hypothetical protein
VSTLATMSRPLGKGMRGASDVTRGTINQSVDSPFSEKAGEAKNQAVTEGINEVESAGRIAT